MSEEVYGIIKVIRPAFGRTINEQLLFTPDRVIVARLSGGFGGMFFGVIGAGVEAVIQARKGKKKEEKYAKLSLESVLTADKHNYAIPNSEITKVEFKKSWRSSKIHITKGKKKHKWTVMGVEINQTLLTPTERKKYEEEVLSPLRKGSGSSQSERKKALEDLMQWCENRILRQAFPESKLSI